MKSICRCELKQDYENYVNDVDILGHVIEEDKVYLRLGRRYEFCIHADFTVSSAKNVQVLGNNSDLTKFAKIRITNLSTNESRVINPTKLINFEEGNYKLDYGVWIDDNKETYTTPQYTFQQCPEVTYIQVDPIVTKLDRAFVGWNSNLTGIMFGEPDQYPEGPCVFSEPYSHNDVIVNNHITFYDGSTRFLQGCSKIKNVYIGDEVTGFSGCFGFNNPCMWQVNRQSCITNSSTYKSEIYLGAKVTNLKLQASNKIYKCIISPENTSLVYDPAINSIIRSNLNSEGKKVILTGLGTGYVNGYLKIPSGYVFGNSYETYSSLADIKVLDLSEFDSVKVNPDGVVGVYFDGFRDLGNLETLILPRNVHFLPSIYANGFGKVKNLVVPTEIAPLVSWGPGDWGDRAHIMTINYTCLFSGSNCDCPVGYLAPKDQRNLYVLDSNNQSNKDTWNNDYDYSTVHDWLQDKNNPSLGYVRPNAWKYVQMNATDPSIPVNYSNCWHDNTGEISAYYSPCQEFTLNYLSEQQMTNLISSLNPNNNN